MEIYPSCAEQLVESGMNGFPRIELPHHGLDDTGIDQGGAAQGAVLRAFNSAPQPCTHPPKFHLPGADDGHGFVGAWAIALLFAGLNVEQIKEVLGQQTVKMTLPYTDLNGQEKVDAVNPLLL